MTTRTRLAKVEKAAHMTRENNPPMWGVVYDGQPGMTLAYADGRREHVDSLADLPAGWKFKGYRNVSPDDWDMTPNPQCEPIKVQA